MFPDGAPQAPVRIASPANPRIKEAVRLRQRSHRDEAGLMIIEGYRELRRALDHGIRPLQLFYCPEFYLGTNEPQLVADAAAAGAELLECTRPAFEKIAYRDRPEGLLAVAPQLRRTLAELVLPPDALVIVAEAIEKPGNLGTILRSADATGVAALVLCDRCTDLHNPNVVRASTGTLFTVPVVETTTADALAWLRRERFRVVAATPHTDTIYTDADLTGRIAVVVGTEQYGLSETWMKQADINVRIPMLGVADSLNVAAATTLLLYEAVRQRGPLTSREAIR